MINLAKQIGHLILDTLNKALDDDIMTMGAAIAFYTIFSIAPIFLIIVALSGIFISEEVLSEQIKEQIKELLGGDMAENLMQFLNEHSLQSGSIVTTIFATLIIIFGATTVINQLKLSLNSIWNVTEVKISSVWKFLLNRLLSFGMVIVISLLLLSSLIAEAMIALLAALIFDLVPFIQVDFYRILTQITTLGFAITFFALIFRILPDVNVSWKHIFVGATVTTLLFLLGKYLIGFYLSTTGLQATYKAAGTLVIFIIWVYYNVLTILLGAVFTQVYTDRYGGTILPYSFVVLREKIRAVVSEEEPSETEEQQGEKKE
ncbi:MAG: YihY/virulence factor BrkB family protein [Balneolaceae bacterium]